MSNTRRLRRDRLRGQGVLRPDPARAALLDGAPSVHHGHGRGQANYLGGGLRHESALQRKLAGCGPATKTTVPPRRSLKHGSKAGRR